ncbi:hypothetical protein [Leptotrichia wadei]|uniref:hypothetical protein n=1 Tax=Leptotrichia wadei TaxID=157687 RepID=UPI0028E54654|nr:hypothetical protein [Leptotrichia wadei]
MKQATLDLIKNIDENTFIPPSTKNELFELFQLDTVADLRKVSRNFMKLYEILEHLDSQTSSATTEKAGIVKFGTETGNVIDAETWKQAIGQSLGGYVSKVESKEAGKWYINDLTDGKIYKCIQNHTSKSFDITKFVDITNVGLSDKVENLSNVETYVIDPRLTVGLIYKIGNICILILDTNEVYNGRSYGDVLFNIPEKFRPRFRTPVSVGIISSTSGGAAHIETNGNVVWRGARTSLALYINAVYLAN